MLTAHQEVSPRKRQCTPTAATTGGGSRVTLCCTLTMRTASERLAHFAVSLKLEAVPEAVVEKTKRILLDAIGIALAASRTESGQMVIRLARALGGQPESQVIGAELRTSAANAVLANGTLTHALDFDDTLEEGIIHAGSCVGVTALAVGEACRLSGRQVLEAAIAGFEVMYKIGVAAPGRFHARGYHPTSVCAPFGAATVAGLLYGLSSEQMIHAFGIAGSQSSGIIEYLADGSWTKQFHPGWGSHAGIIAALLAREGFRGPRTVLEGRRGFYAAFAGPEAPILERLDEIGTNWELPRVMFKSYPCGSIAHPYLDCALRIRQQHQPPAADIDRIVCRTHEGPVPRLWEPLEQKQRPVTPYAAKFSLPYSIAVALVRGRAGPEEFSESLHP